VVGGVADRFRTFCVPSVRTPLQADYLIDKRLPLSYPVSQSAYCASRKGLRGEVCAFRTGLRDPPKALPTLSILTAMVARMSALATVALASGRRCSLDARSVCSVSALPTLATVALASGRRCSLDAQSVSPIFAFAIPLQSTPVENVSATPLGSALTWFLGLKSCGICTYVKTWGGRGEGGLPRSPPVETPAEFVAQAPRLRFISCRVRHLRAFRPVHWRTAAPWLFGTAGLDFPAAQIALGVSSRRVLFLRTLAGGAFRNAWLAPRRQRNAPGIHPGPAPRHGAGRNT
jgi:hypothetical protein